MFTFLPTNWGQGESHHIINTPKLFLALYHVLQKLLLLVLCAKRLATTPYCCHESHKCIQDYEFMYWFHICSLVSVLKKENQKTDKLVFALLNFCQFFEPWEAKSRNILASWLTFNHFSIFNHNDANMSVSKKDWYNCLRKLLLRLKGFLIVLPRSDSQD